MTDDRDSPGLYSCVTSLASCGRGDRTGCVMQTTIKELVN